MTIIEKYSEETFENIKHLTDEGIEFWYARELQIILEYKEWRNFTKVIDKAKIACNNSDNNASNHFVDVNKMVEAGITAKGIEDYQLTRYACYLIVQNGDPRKEVIALGQTYFAVKTRQQELIAENSVVRNFRTTAEDAKSYNTNFYNLDVIISVGYRIKSLVGTKFRIWATKRLNEYIIKGFTMNDDRGLI